MWLITKLFPYEPHECMGVKTGERREGEPSIPPVPQPSVHRPSGQKRDQGRDILNSIEKGTENCLCFWEMEVLGALLLSADSMNKADCQYVGYGLAVRSLRTHSPQGRTNQYC